MTKTKRERYEPFMETDGSPATRFSLIKFLELNQILEAPDERYCLTGNFVLM